MRKASRGDELNIPARDWNKLVDVAGAGSVGIGASPRGAGLGGDWVWVKNTLGRDLKQYAAVMLNDPTDQADGKADLFFPLVNPSLRGQYAAFGEYNRVIGILPEPIADGRIGKAQISGVCIARFNGTEVVPSAAATGYPFANLSDRNDSLVQSASGPIQILAKNFNFSTDDTLAYVRINDPYSIAECMIPFTTTQWAQNANNTTIACGDPIGDARTVGISRTGGNNYPCLARNGRYLITVEWWMSITSFNQTYSNNVDLFLARQSWENPVGTIVVGEPTYHSGGVIPVNIWLGTGRAPKFHGSRAFRHTRSATGPNTVDNIPIPGIAVWGVRYGSSGSASTEVGGGGGRIHVIYLGPRCASTSWSDDDRYNVWNRLADAGPIDAAGDIIDAGGEESPPPP